MSAINKIQKNKGFTPTPFYKGVSLRSKRGFTLVEMLVAIAVFMSVMVVAVGALMTIINVNKKDRAIKSVVDNVSFALDVISRDMRTGNNYQCSNDGNSYNITNCTNAGSPAVSYVAADGTTTEYWFNPSPNPGDGNIQEKKCPGACPTQWVSLTAPTSTVAINNMKFYLFNLNDPTKSPQLLITAQGSVTTQTGSTTFSLQTTVSQRSR
jgi:type II secretory pathway pseudopilin PulG